MQTNKIPEHFLIKVDSFPNPESVVSTGHARFTILTPRLIRMEWSPIGKFEDRASQAFWFRNHPRPKYNIKQMSPHLVVETEFLILTYQSEMPFSSDTLKVEIKETGVIWHFGDEDPDNLGGTARTLDEVDGSTEIGPGLVSRSGWATVDDSSSLVFNDDSWLEQRKEPPGQVDLYLLGYGHDYIGCLREFNLVAGSVPMVPRFVLGNWWSRYWRYTQEDIIHLMNDFEEHNVPLSVCIIDMDWHITKTGNTSSGWTGYTWNRELFPDPAALLKLLHEKGLMVALNLHPADGIHPHEEDYDEMCKAVGIDPGSSTPVEFDITNPRFVNAYFNILHHPQEKRGIDFWWMDWQQGKKTRLSGLDPLWWLNHLHFLDLGRDGKRRSFIFSRWGGLGNHRYPIGFSGDSVITWNSLAFQPYFTATASNVNYGWWSHDIGGHMGGVEDAELYARWIQLGVFLPILRLHSTNNPYLERRPWGYDAETFEVAKAAMQLRHALIPYLYSMAWRYHSESIPPDLPMYYHYQEKEEAYSCPNQFMYGNQLLVAPFIQPSDHDTRLSRSIVWLPDGDWFDYFTGQYYPSGWHAVYGTLRDTPVFAKAGAIIPQGQMVGKGGIEAPNHLMVNVFAGANGKFDLYEDEGNTNFYLDGAYAITPIRQTWSEDRTTFTYGPAQGDINLIPDNRHVDFCFRGFTSQVEVVVNRNGVRIPINVAYKSESYSVVLEGVVISPNDQVEVILSSNGKSLANRIDSRKDLLMKMIKHFRMENNAKEDLAHAVPDLLKRPAGLARFLSSLVDSQITALCEVICEAGVDVTFSTGKPVITLWNRKSDENVKFLVSLQRVHHWWRYPERRSADEGTCPQFKTIRPVEEFGEDNPWLVQVNYYGLYMNKLEN